MICLQKPDTEQLAPYLSAWHDTPLSYSAAPLHQHHHPGFITDQHRVRLGHGTEVYHTAARALDQWEMFPAWASVARQKPGGQVPGQIVAMIARICGLWWVNPCRILRRCDSADTHGFVYGTLPEHAECGEEQFLVEIQPDGSVWYVIRAFSRPRHTLAWIAFPLARWWQCRFVRDSQAAMVKKVANSQPAPTF